MDITSFKIENWEWGALNVIIHLHSEGVARILKTICNNTAAFAYGEPRIVVAGSD